MDGVAILKFPLLPVADLTQRLNDKLGDLVMSETADNVLLTSAIIFILCIILRPIMPDGMGIKKVLVFLVIFFSSLLVCVASLISIVWLR